MKSNTYPREIDQDFSDPLLDIAHPASPPLPEELQSRKHAKSKIRKPEAR